MAESRGPEEGSENTDWSDLLLPMCSTDFPKFPWDFLLEFLPNN